MNVYIQQRKSLRRAIAVECRVLRQRDNAIVGTTSVDLSLEGMLVPTWCEMEAKEPLVVTFRIPQLRRTFSTDAHVARFLRGRRGTDRRGPCIGIEFDSLDALSRLYLGGHLRRVPPPLPARSKRVDYAATIRKIAGFFR
ncbi:MAG: PilZ domain-containing protein [Polyangiaceae bacterium]|nr:PilZ domain-containing protein [Polyangiaceae bacterium]